LRNNLETILVAALEITGRDELGSFKFSGTQKDALMQARFLIEQDCTAYPGNYMLVKKPT